MSVEQIQEVHEALRKNKELQKKTAKELRKQGKTQPEVAAAIGVPRQTLSDWEQEEKKETSTTNADSGISCIHDCRVVIPKTEHQAIFERVQDGESQKEVAADYGVKQQTIANHRDVNNSISGDVNTPDCRVTIPTERLRSPLARLLRQPDPHGVCVEERQPAATGSRDAPTRPLRVAPHQQGQATCCGESLVSAPEDK